MKKKFPGNNNNMSIQFLILTRILTFWTKDVCIYFKTQVKKKNSVHKLVIPTKFQVEKLGEAFQDISVQNKLLPIFLTSIFASLAGYILGLCACMMCMQVKSHTFKDNR